MTKFRRPRLWIPRPVLESPWEIFAAFLCVVGGLPLLITGPDKSASSIDRAIPPLLVSAWAGSLFIGGMLILIGRFRRKTSFFRIERSGVLLLGGAAFVYAISILAVRRLSGLVAFLTLLIFAMTCFVHYYKLGKAIEALAQTYRAIDRGDVSG